MTTDAALPIAAVAVRPALPSDLGRVLEIERRSFADPWSAEAFGSALALSHLRFLVAERAREPEAPELLGYVVAMAAGDEGEIADIAVSPAARRGGVGGILLRRMVEVLVAAGVRSLYLEVRESNTAARALYESEGFAPVGRRRGYYRNPLEDALLLRREIGTDGNDKVLHQNR